MLEKYCTSCLVLSYHCVKPRSVLKKVTKFLYFHNMQNLRTICFHTLLLLPFFLIAQSPNLSFHRVGVEDGLSQGNVNCLLRDSDGFAWIGTQDGLNRFDGYEFKNFYHRQGDSGSLSNNFVWALLEDSHRRLWVGTMGIGLCRYDKESEQFRSFSPKSSVGGEGMLNAVRSLCEYPKNKLWVGRDKGLQLFDLETETFVEDSIFAVGGQAASLQHITALQVLGKGRLLVGSAEGLSLLNISERKLKKIDLPTGSILKIRKEKNQDFWVATNRGLFKIRCFPESDSTALLHHFQKEAGNPRSLPGNSVFALLKDENNFLWVGTNAGLGCLNTQNLAAGFVSYSHDGKHLNSLSNNLVYALCAVEPGLIWAGTREGISRFSSCPPVFFNLRFEESGLCSNNVLGMTEDGQGNFWIGTKGGLTRVSNFGESRNLWEMECFNTSNAPGMRNDYIMNLTADSKGTLWAVYRRNGFSTLKTGKSGGISFSPPDKFATLFSKTHLTRILEDSRGDYWLATSSNGLYHLSAASRKLTAYNAEPEDSASLTGNYIFDLMEDDKGQLWVSVNGGGLCKINPREATFSCFTHDPKIPASLSDNMVLSTFRDSAGRLWVCTANGLNLLEKEGKFRRFFKTEGLPNDVVYGMLEDTQGNLWVSTNKGISKISFRDGVFETQNFDLSHGLQGNEFNQYAFYKTHDGRLCFGGTGGLTIFDPADIQADTFVSSVVLTDFQLFNQSVRVARQVSDTYAEGFFLPKAINLLEEVCLRHHQNFIAFEFTAPAFRSPEKQQFAYKMEGLDKDWILCGNRRYAGYPNLPPGDYTFLVKAANHDGFWNERPKSIRIRVLLPPWKTWWAYLLYLLAAGMTVLGIVRFRVQSVRRLEQAKEEEREAFRKRSARDFHDEAGNKITKIALLTEMAKRQSGDQKDLRTLLTQIEQNIQDLRFGMRDFIWVLDPSNDNLYETLLRLKDFANGFFEYSDIHFTTRGLEESLLQIPMSGSQRRHLLLIFKEAINNCLKYSRATHAKLEILKRDNAVILTFSDDGVGFDKNKEKRGNGLKNMQMRAEKLGGRFTISPKKDRGTFIELMMGIPKRTVEKPFRKV